MCVSRVAENSMINQIESFLSALLSAADRDFLSVKPLSRRSTC